MSGTTGDLPMKAVMVGLPSPRTVGGLALGAGIALLIVGMTNSWRYSGPAARVSVRTTSPQQDEAAGRYTAARAAGRQEAARASARETQMTRK
jgi:hypothetical protein